MRHSEQFFTYSSLLEASCGVLERSQGVLEASLVVWSRLRDVLKFLADFSSELEAPWRRPGGFLELPWTLFSESGKRFGRDITLSVYFEEVRSQFRGRFVLILEVKTERS